MGHVDVPDTCAYLEIDDTFVCVHETILITDAHTQVHMSLYALRRVHARTRKHTHNYWS